MHRAFFVFKNHSGILEARRGRVGGRRSTKNLYEYLHNPWTPTIWGRGLKGVEVEGCIKEINGWKKGTYLILSTIKFFF